MNLKKLARRSFSCATMGLALTGSAFAQSLDAAGDAGINADSGQATGSIQTDAELSGAGQNASADAAATGNLDGNRAGTDAGANAGINTNRQRLGADASADIETDGANAGADLNADVNTNGTNAGADVDADINANDTNVGADGNANVNANGTRLNGDAGIRSNGQNAGGDVDANVNSNLDANFNSSRDGVDLDSQQRAGLNADTDRFGATFDSSVSNGLVISESRPDSIASRIGLQAGDRIIGFNGRRYTDVNRFQADLRNFDGNRNIPLIYERNGRLYSRDIRLSQQNSFQTNNGVSVHSQSYGSGQMSHSVGRPNYSDSDSYTSGHSAQGQVQVGNDFHGGNQTGYYGPSYRNRGCCQPCGYRGGRHFRYRR